MGMDSHRRGDRPVLRRLLVPFSLALLSTVLAGASCGKSKPDDATGTPKVVATPAPPVELSRGVKISGLDSEQRDQFLRLIDKAQSPCGKAHSLKTSLETDLECGRAPFAVRYLAKWVGFGASDDEALEMYAGRYEQPKLAEIDVAGSPYSGMKTARVVLVEFFDYTCPHCKKMVPVLEDVAAEFSGDVIIYYKFFPLAGEGHEQSIPCSVAAIAAAKQGKFHEMHRKLFAMQEKDQSNEAIMQAAKDIGLDMVAFKAAFDDPRTRDRVMADKAIGDKLELGGTPALYINGRNYPPIIEFEELKDWVTEELAVNQ